MKHTRIFFAVFFLSVAGLFALGQFASAQTGINVSPAIIEEKVNPGEGFTRDISVTNLDSVEKIYYIVKRDIEGLDDSGLPIFAREGERSIFTVSDWITVSTESVVVPPQRTETISVTIGVPQDASPGGHFGGVFFATTPPTPERTGIGIGYQVGTILNLRISGEIVESATLREFTTDKSVYSEPKVTFTVVVENKGNTLLRPRGPISITNSFGKEVGTVIMNEQGSAVLPGGKRMFTVMWDKGSFGIGRYQAVLGIIYGDEVRVTLPAVLSFWVLPLNVILPIVGGIFLFVGSILLYIRLHIRKKVKELIKHTQSVAEQKDLHLTEEQFAPIHREAPVSRLMFIAVFMLLSSLFFLALLFIVFA